jgi:hypothetical protein
MGYLWKNVGYLMGYLYMGYIMGYVWKIVGYR